MKNYMRYDYSKIGKIKLYCLGNIEVIHYEKETRKLTIQTYGRNVLAISICHLCESNIGAIYNYLLNFFNGLCPINHKWLMTCPLYMFLFHNRFLSAKERKKKVKIMSFL